MRFKGLGLQPYSPIETKLHDAKHASRAARSVKSRSRPLNPCARTSSPKCCSSKKKHKDSNKKNNNDVAIGIDDVTIGIVMIVQEWD